MSNHNRSIKTELARKITMAAVATLSLGFGTVLATQPAAAFGGGHGGGFHGGGFHGGGILRHGNDFGGFHRTDFRHRFFGRDGGFYDAYDGYDGCYRYVWTAFGYRTVDVCE